MAEIRQYRAFVEVERLGSISDAADYLSVSQPALSKQIAELERDFGLKLFERHARGVRATEAAKDLLSFARRVCWAVADAEREASDLRGLRTGHISIGSSTTIADYLVAPAVALFCQRFPGLSVSVRVGNTRDIAHAVAQEECELGLVEGPTSEPNLDSRPFFRDELIVVAPPGHPLLSRVDVSVSDVFAFGVVMRERGSGTRAIIEEAVGRFGVAIREVATLGSTEAVKRGVRLGMGIGVVSRLTVADEIAEGALFPVPVEALQVIRPLTRLIRSGRGVSRALRAMIRALDDSLVQDPQFRGFDVPGSEGGDWDPGI